MTRSIRLSLPSFLAVFLLLGLASSASAMILVKIPGAYGASGVSGYDEWFVADSFSFGVEREMKESGEKGGTQDINIGVGELQECTISKSMDNASALLAQFAINGNSLGNAEIVVLEDVGQGKPVVTMHYTLERAFVKSWSTSGDAGDPPTEEVAFYYNKIGFVYSPVGGSETSGGWDVTTNTPY